MRILVRGCSSHDALVKAGAEAVRGDLKDANSLRAACAGADAVITTANSVGRAGDDTVESVDRHGNRNLVESADAAGVRRFLFISALGADTQSPMPFLRAKGETEKRIRDSSMDWTILEPNVFMDIWVPAVVGGPAPSGRPVTLVGEGRRPIPSSPGTMLRLIPSPRSIARRPRGRRPPLPRRYLPLKSWYQVSNMVSPRMSKLATHKQGSRDPLELALVGRN